MSSTESRVSTKKAGIPMRTETEMFDVILQTAKVLQVDAVAMSGSRTNPKAPKDELQDYDVVYIVEDLDGLIADLFLAGPVRQTYHRARGYSGTPPSLPHVF